MVTLKLEPALFALQISSDEVFVRFSQIQDAFDNANNGRHAGGKSAGNDAAHKSYEQHDQTFRRVSEDELMYPEAPEQNSTHTGNHLLVGTLRLPVNHLSLRIIWLDGLVSTTAHSRQWGLATHAILRCLVVGRATLCAISGHIDQSRPASERISIYYFE